MSRYPDNPPARDLQDKGQEGCLAKKAHGREREWAARVEACYQPLEESAGPRVSRKEWIAKPCTGRLHISAEAQEGKGADDL